MGDFRGDFDNDGEGAEKVTWPGLWILGKLEFGVLWVLISGVSAGNGSGCRAIFSMAVRSDCSGWLLMGSGVIDNAAKEPDQVDTQLIWPS